MNELEQVERGLLELVTRGKVVAVCRNNVVYYFAAHCAPKDEVHLTPREIAELSQWDWWHELN